MKVTVSWLGWALAALLVAALSWVCVSQWSALRMERGRLSHALLSTGSRIEKNLELSSKRWLSLTDDLRKELTSLRAVVEKLGSVKEGTTGDEPVHADVVLPEAALSPEVPEVHGKGGHSPALPLLPEGVQPQEVIRQPLLEIAKDPRFNPGIRRLSPVESALAIAEWTRARAELEVLESEIVLGMIQAQDKLRPLGAFVEYGPGEKYLHERGVLTSAETIEGGSLRMFYLRPEEFPEIYEKRARKADIAETAVRRLVQIFKG